MATRHFGSPAASLISAVMTKVGIGKEEELAFVQKKLADVQKIKKP